MIQSPAEPSDERSCTQLQRDPQANSAARHDQIVGFHIEKSTLIFKNKHLHQEGGLSLPSELDLAVRRKSRRPIAPR